MSPTRRRSRHNVLADLPPAQQEQLVAWLVSGDTYKVVRLKLQQQFGIEISIETISVFWRRFVAPVIEEQEETVARIVRRKWHERLQAKTEPA